MWQIVNGKVKHMCFFFKKNPKSAKGCAKGLAPVGWCGSRRRPEDESRGVSGDMGLPTTQPEPLRRGLALHSRW